MNYKCPICNYSLAVNDKMIGHQIKCPNCSSNVEIPSDLLFKLSSKISPSDSSLKKTETSVSNKKKKEDDEEKDLLDMIEPVIKLAENFLKNQTLKLQSKDNSELRNYKLALEELNQFESKSKRNYYLLFLSMLFIFALSTGIIFILKDISSGLLILSHIGAVVSGLLAGMGYERSKSKELS